MNILFGKWIFIVNIAAVIAVNDDTSDITINPSIIPSVSPSTPSPTRARRTRSPTHAFAAIANGGFEDDAETVITKGAGYYSMLPSGWDEYHAAAMISYEHIPNHYQENSGEIFLQIFASHDGYIVQNITSCQGMSFFLTFTISSYSCSGCGMASIKVSANGLVIYHDDEISYNWERHYVSFTSQSYIFALKFETAEATSAQLLLDDIVMIHDAVSCSPTVSPTSYPSEIPTEKPSSLPTGVPTGIAVMMVISGQLTFEGVTYSDKLSEQELTAVQYVITSYVEAAARSVAGYATVLLPVGTQLNDKALAINFDVEVLKGPTRDIFSDKYSRVFNVTRASLSSAVSSKTFLVDLAYALHTLQHEIGAANTSLMITSDSEIFLDFYEIMEMIDHRGQRIRVKQPVGSNSRMKISMEKMEVILVAAIVGGMLLLGVVLGFLQTSRAASKEDDNNDKTLLECVSPQLEMGNMLKSAKGNFEKVMQSSSHAFESVMQSSSHGGSTHNKILHSLVPTTEEAPLPDLRKNSEKNLKSNDD